LLEKEELELLHDAGLHDGNGFDFVAVQPAPNDWLVLPEL
jgi:hypothetical protein